MNTGKKIEKARQQKGWSKAELHRRSGVAYTTIVDLEREVRGGNFETICVLADALEVTTDSLRPDKEGDSNE